MKKPMYLRICSIFLSIAMLISCQVFAMPAANAAEETYYTYTVRFTTSDKLDCNDNNGVHVYILTKADNGTGGTGEFEVEGGGKSGDWMRMVQDGTETAKTGNTSNYAFPYGVRIEIDGDAGMGDHNWWGRCYLDVNGINIINGVQCHVEAGGGVWHENKTVTSTCAGEKYPVVSSITDITGSDTVAVPEDDSTVSATYAPGSILDQFGVKWHTGTPALSAQVSNQVTFSNNKLNLTCACNREADYTCTITETYGDVTNTKEVAIQTFTYTVTFKDYDGRVIDTQEGILYGGSAIAPEAPTREQSDTTVYTFSSWQGMYTALSGTQNKTVTAVYTQTDRLYDVTFKNHDGSVLGTKGYKWHEQIVVPETVVPQKQADGQIYSSWEFSGWSPSIDASTIVTGEGMEFTAQFTGVKKPYTIRFTDEGGNDIIDPQVLTWGDMPVIPQNVTKSSTEQYEYTFSGWDQEVVPVSGSVIYVAQFTPHVREYTLTFLRADGTVIKTVSNQPYGSVPTDDLRLVPALIPKQADAQYHYTAAWDTNINAPITGNTTYQIVYTPVAHTWSKWSVVSEPTCEDHGNESRTCSACAYLQERDILPTGHDMCIHSSAPENGVEGLLYYECANGCGRVATCVTDAGGNASIGAVCTREELKSESLAVPTTVFNVYQNESEAYDYFTRGAALRVDPDEAPDVQAMRFASSMLLPQGVEIIDFGYVYTREDKFKTMAKFVIGGKDVSDLSVKNGYYTDHQTDAGTVRTFNIVLHIENENWDYNYLVRPYITYTFAGQSFTVYDDMYAGRSVNYVADKIVHSSNEPEFIKEFIYSKIIGS